MIMLMRRDFLKQSSLLAIGFFIDSKGLLANPGLEQKIVVNLPAYELNLQDLQDGKVIRTSIFSCSIGRGAEGREPTPLGEGFVYEKRKVVIFRYNEDYPLLKKKKDDIIFWNNTFDENGKPIGQRLPYPELRGLGMKIKPINKNRYDPGKVIHSTLDDFTVGLPTSHGCVGIAKKDMLELYALVAPSVDDGDLDKLVKVKTVYDLVEIKEGQLLVHANVYNRTKDYVRELEMSLLRANRLDVEIGYERAKKEFTDANKEFNEAHKKILATLLKPYPHNYVPPELKKKLHRSYNLKDFVKPEI